MYFPEGFNKERALELAALVRSAYEQLAAYEDEKDWSPPPGYELLAPLNYPINRGKNALGIGTSFDIDVKRKYTIKKQNNDEMPIGFIARKKKDLFVIFRGTKTVKEWIKNFNMGLTEFFLPGQGEVHEGFLSTYTLVRDEIKKLLETIPAKARIFVAGHSLGAALATLAAMDLEIGLGRRLAAIYTFGSPRVGNAKFSDSFGTQLAERSFRVANSSDIVTSIPLPVPLAGFVGGYFSHVETQVSCNSQNNESEINHAMATYIAELEKAKDGRGLWQRLLGRG